MIDLNLKDKPTDEEIIKKSTQKTKVKKKSKSLFDTIQSIIDHVAKYLGKYKQEYGVITTVEELEKYVEKANKDGYIAIDTETTGLSPYNDKLAGICLYSKSQKPVYVPVNHVDYITEERCENQLTEEEIAPILKKLNARVLMHNADFDIRFLRHQLGVYLDCYWDTLIASKLMNENEPNHKLKFLHQKYVLRNREEEQTFADFFSGIVFTFIPIDCAFLYAAHDAIITYELFEFQQKVLNDKHTDRQDLNDVYKLFMEIEMPIVKVVCDIEDMGIDLDFDYINNYLKPKYETLRQESLSKCQAEIEKYREQINKYIATHENNKLDDPINIKSPTQLAILLYDIIKLKPKGNTRSTGKETLESLNTPLTREILNFRAVEKLMSTYIDKLPKVVESDNKVHARFNQIGALTGRFSSSSPNLQNIPAKNTEIRKMFTGGIENRYINLDNKDTITLEKCEEVQLKDNNWKFAEQLVENDIIITDEGSIKVENIKVEPKLTGKVEITFSRV